MEKFYPESDNDIFNESLNSITLYNDDCLNVLKTIPEDSINFIITSPPYADQRKKTYGGIHPDEYVKWFSPIGKELLRVLKKDGTFILNIKEKIVNGERHTYVIDLIKEMRDIGWLWTEEYIWHKKTCFPGKWPNRFRDAWERLLQFNKNKKFQMFQDEVMVDVGDWAKVRLKSISKNDTERKNSLTGSGLSRRISNWVSRKKVYPTNVLYLSSETSNRSHSAVFPKSLPSWFISLFTKEGDIILDPFMGSGTSVICASEMKRDGIGIEKDIQCYNIAKEEILKDHKKHIRR